MSALFSVKNFERFQHYKDSSPPWIKFHNSTLDDYDFGRLPDASKWHLAAIWLLASRYENRIPYDAEWIAKRINATSAVDLDLLISSGFIVVEQARSKPLARRKQTAMPETERETEAEKNSGANAPAGPPAIVTPLDLKRQLWATSRAYLATNGIAEERAGSLIGKWLKALGGGSEGQTALLTILASAEANCQGNVIEYIEAAIERHHHGRADNGEDRGGFGAVVAAARAVAAGH